MFSLKNEDKKTKRIIFLVIAVFIVLGTYSVVTYGDDVLLGSFEKWDDDDVKYIRSAWTLMDTGKFTYHSVNEETIFIMPGITYVLAGFTNIFGKFTGIIIFRIFQVMIQALSLLMVFFIARKLFNSKVALIAFMLEAIYVPNFWVPHLVLTECIFKFLVLFLVYFTIYALEEKKIIYYFIGGVILALGCFFRPTISAYPIVVLILWIYKKYKLKDMIKFALIVTSTFIIVMAPWWIRNHKEFNQFIPFTLSSGNPMVKGSYIHYNKDIDAYPVEQTDDKLKQEEFYMDNLKYRFKNYMLKNPVRYGTWYLVEKPIWLWITPFYWPQKQIIFYIFYGITFLQHLVVIGVGIYGFYAIFKKRREENSNNIVYILFFMIIYYTIIHVPYVTFDRYGYPMIWIFVIAASFVLKEKFQLKAFNKNYISIKSIE